MTLNELCHWTLSKKKIVSNLEAHYFLCAQKLSISFSYKCASFNFNTLIFLLITITVYVMEIFRLFFLLSLFKQMDLSPFECLFVGVYSRFEDIRGKIIYSALPDSNISRKSRMKVGSPSHAHYSCGTLGSWPDCLIAKNGSAYVIFGMLFSVML